jgi:hypothetical protein
VRVPHVVKPPLADARLRAERAERLGEPLWADRAAQLVGEDQVPILVGVAGAPVRGGAAPVSALRPSGAHVERGAPSCTDLSLAGSEVGRDPAPRITPSKGAIAPPIPAMPAGLHRAHTR